MTKQTILQGQVLDVIKTLPSNHFQCVLTSSPYYGLRRYSGDQDYLWGADPNCQHEFVTETKSGISGGTKSKKVQIKGKENFQIVPPSEYQYCIHCNAQYCALGQEPTSELFIQHLVEIFREVKRVLRSDGIFWLNLGDSYAGSLKGKIADGWWVGGKQATNEGSVGCLPCQDKTRPNKNLLGVPWRTAFALQEDGWILRAGLPWLRRNTMPESTSDRPTCSMEYFFMLVKSPEYYYDAESIRLTAKCPERNKYAFGGKKSKTLFSDDTGQTRVIGDRKTDNKRAFRTYDLLIESIYPPHGVVADADGNPLLVDAVHKGISQAHFATFPTDLITPLIKSSASTFCCPECSTPYERIMERETNGEKVIKTTKGWRPQCNHSAVSNDKLISSKVLDPFSGSGTTLLVCQNLGIEGTGIEVSEEYIKIAKDRIIF